MYDVSLYGHLTLDRVFDGDRKDNTVGSIGNVWKYLNKINPGLKINIEPTDIGEALILIDTIKSERASVANLSLKTRKPYIVNSDWSHVLYINELLDLSFLSKLTTGIVSADICRGKTLDNLDVLRYIDFLFISDEDIFMDISELSKLVKRGVICHHKGGSAYYDKDGSCLETDVHMLDNVNVLGCGDMLVSYFINEYLKCNKVEESIQRAHLLVTKYLKGNQ